MFITKTEVDVAVPSALAAIGDRQAVHRAVAGSLPPLREQDTSAGRTLWRIQSGNGLHLITVSPARPDPAALRNRFGGQSTTKEYDLSPYLAAGARFRFDVEANPAVTKRSADGGRTTRRAPAGVRARLDWLGAQGARNGFRVDDVEVSSDIVKIERGDGVSSLVLVRFQGVLTVTDPEAMSRVLVNGIGRGKAFGAGLVLLSK